MMECRPTLSEEDYQLELKRDEEYEKWLEEIEEEDYEYRD